MAQKRSVADEVAALRRRLPGALICTACADACKRCGDACDEFKDDPMMKECAQECRRCEKACREMLRHTAAAAKQ